MFFRNTFIIAQAPCHFQPRFVPAVATVYLTWPRTGDIKQAVKEGRSVGIQIFGIFFVQHMVVLQIARTGLANALLAPRQYIVGRFGYHASASIVNGIRALPGKGAIDGTAS